MSERLRVAVVGCGIGRFHMAGIKELPEECELRAICDVKEEAARAAADEFGATGIVTDFDELCRRDDVDVIDLATPPFLHREQILKALAAGKHVVCEKPLVGSMKEVFEIREAAKASKGVLMPVFQTRFGAGIQKLKFLVDRGLAGPVYTAQSDVSWRRRADYYAIPWRGKWKSELGGVLLTHAIHSLDGMCWLCGPVRSVFARAATRVNPVETEDCAVVSLEFEQGGFGALAATLGAGDEVTRLRYNFRDLCAESLGKAYEATHEPWKYCGDTPEQDEKVRAALAEYKDKPEDYAGQYHGLYLALRNGTPPPVTIDDSVRSIELLTACYVSIQTGKPVELPLAPDHPAWSGWAPGTWKA